MLSNLAKYADSAIFGSFDGITVTLGILFSLTGNPLVIFSAILGVAAAEGVGMAAGEWLSESDNGFGAAITIGAATALGSVLPALPFLFTSGALALGLAFSIIALIGVVITALRYKERGLWRALLETYGVMIVVSISILITQYLFGA